MDKFRKILKNILNFLKRSKVLYTLGTDFYKNALKDVGKMQKFSKAILDRIIIIKNKIMDGLKVFLNTLLNLLKQIKAGFCIAGVFVRTKFINGVGRSKKLIKKIREGIGRGGK